MSECSISGCLAPFYARGFCKKHHQWRWKRGLIQPIQQPSIAEKLEENSIPVTESGCWIWLLHTNNKGYGVISTGHQGRDFAHRAAYREHVGVIAVGMEVCHRCDVPCCCNPRHLFLGTHLQNMADSARKGRAKQPVLKTGHGHPRAALSPEVLALCLSDRRPATELAQQIGCNPETIRRARRGETYA